MVFKSKPGRPRKPAKDRRSTGIAIPLTRVQKRAVERMAGSDGVAAWARDILLKAIARKKRPPT